jgi:hypothetical protein
VGDHEGTKSDHLDAAVHHRAHPHYRFSHAARL